MITAFLLYISVVVTATFLLLWRFFKMAWNDALGEMTFHCATCREMLTPNDGHFCRNCGNCKVMSCRCPAETSSR